MDYPPRESIEAVVPPVRTLDHTCPDSTRLGEEYRIEVSNFSARRGHRDRPEDQDRIFEAFEHLHTREEHPGTGIGLALCNRIVKRHGGTINVESEPDVGTTFTMTLSAANNN